jgi:hypothetical protein
VTDPYFAETVSENSVKGVFPKQELMLREEKKLPLRKHPQKKLHKKLRLQSNFCSDKN